MDDNDREGLVVKKVCAEIDAAAAALALERHDLESERAFLKRRLVEEDERLSHA